MIPKDVVDRIVLHKAMLPTAVDDHLSSGETPSSNKVEEGDVHISVNMVVESENTVKLVILMKVLVIGQKGKKCGPEQWQSSQKRSERIQRLFLTAVQIERESKYVNKKGFVYEIYEKK